jgi:hypothetical protein
MSVTVEVEEVKLLERDDHEPHGHVPDPEEATAEAGDQGPAGDVERFCEWHGWHSLALDGAKVNRKKSELGAPNSEESESSSVDLALLWAASGSDKSDRLLTSPKILVKF